ncbi:MAG: Asp-tRNA(Asn)/Glu-tRNA(Gln) amidotransferase subunit GatC [Chloroflexi bacterium]|nr:Asp-tRNA(Asn)/Glu-tRNA(Gln) amidotransferase subunit GatC [Chloroflexota bacterium]
MADQIDIATFNHMVELAALELDEDEADYLRGELNNQLSVIQELEAVPLDDDIAATSHGIPYAAEFSAQLREDKHIPFEDSAALIDQAPETDDGYIVVPDIPHEDLE